MKIKLKEPVVGLTFSYKAGQEVDVDEKLAQSLINSNVAVSLENGKEEKATIKPAAEKAVKNRTAK